LEIVLISLLGLLGRLESIKIFIHYW